MEIHSANFPLLPESNTEAAGIKTTGSQSCGTFLLVRTLSLVAESQSYVLGASSTFAVQMW